MMSLMKITLLQLLLVSLCALHATSSPRATLTMPQAVESSSQQVAVAVVPASAAEGENEVNKAVTSAVLTGAEVAVAAAQSLPILPADELSPRKTGCGKVGEFCNLADDCCTKRCLTYAKRCVT